MNGRVLAKKRPEVELALHPALQSDHGQAAAEGERAHIALEVGGAHVVEDDVGASSARRLRHDLDKVLELVVDEELGPEGSAGIEFFGATGCDRDPGTERTGHLDRHGADA